MENSIDNLLHSTRQKLTHLVEQQLLAGKEIPEELMKRFSKSGELMVRRALEDYQILKDFSEAGL